MSELRAQVLYVLVMCGLAVVLGAAVWFQW